MHRQAAPVACSPRLPRRLSLWPLAAALALGGTATAQAVPVTVSIGGLPSGLSPTLTVQRNVCPDGMGWVSNPSQSLTETSTTSFERVSLPGGGFTLRQVVITRYVASFDTPVTPANSSNPIEVRCSSTGMAQDLFRFGVRVPGQDAAGNAATLAGIVGEALQSSSVSFNATLAARTLSFTPTLSAMPRGMIHSFEAGYGSSLGSVQSQRLDFLRPSALIPGAFHRVASVFVNSSGVGCVQSGATTRCFGDTALPEAGGVILRGLQRTVLGRPGVVRFQVELMQSFPIGTLKLRAAADASDLAEYLVDGSPQALDLLPWQPLEQTVSVQ